MRSFILAFGIVGVGYAWVVSYDAVGTVIVVVMVWGGGVDLNGRFFKYKGMWLLKVID